MPGPEISTAQQQQQQVAKDPKQEAAEQEEKRKRDIEREAWAYFRNSAEKKVWKRLDGVDPEVEELKNSIDPSAPVLTSKSTLMGLREPGVYQSETTGGMLTLSKDGEVKLLSPPKGFTRDSVYKAVYGDLMDFSSRATGENSITIDWDNIAGVNEKEIKQLMQIALEKKLHVHFGPNLEAYLQSTWGLGLFDKKDKMAARYKEFHDLLTKNNDLVKVMQAQDRYSPEFQDAFEKSTNKQLTSTLNSTPKLAEDVDAAKHKETLLKGVVAESDKVQKLKQELNDVSERMRKAEMAKAELEGRVEEIKAVAPIKVDGATPDAATLTANINALDPDTQKDKIEKIKQEIEDQIKVTKNQTEQLKEENLRERLGRNQEGNSKLIDVIEKVKADLEKRVAAIRLGANELARLPEIPPERMTQEQKEQAALVQKLQEMNARITQLSTTKGEYIPEGKREVGADAAAAAELKKLKAAFTDPAAYSQTKKQAEQKLETLEAALKAVEAKLTGPAARP